MCASPAVDARGRDEHADAIDRDDDQREDDAPASSGTLPMFEKPSKAAMGASA
jgi:hypothetical protein